MGIIDILVGSRIHRALRRAQRWTKDRLSLTRARRERVLKAAVGVLVGVSVVSVLGSNLGSGIKFLSFLVLFTVIAAIVVTVVDPPTDRA